MNGNEIKPCKVLDETACRETPTLHEALYEALATQEAAQEHLSCAFAVLGLEPYNREQGLGPCNTIDEMVRVLLTEMSMLNCMAIVLEQRIGKPKNC